MRTRKGTVAIRRGRPRKPKVGRIDAKLPAGLIERVNELVRDRVDMTRADFVREAVKEKLQANPKRAPVTATEG